MVSPKTFRNNGLAVGAPLGAIDATVTLTADNQFVMTQGLSLIRLYSDNTTATARTFTLQSGYSPVQDPGGNNILTLIFEAGSSYTCQLANTGNVKLTGDWTPIQYQSLTLQWDGFYWIEIGRAPSSTVTSSLTSAHLFVGNASNVATDTAVTGDVTISNTGVTTIGANKVTSGMLAATISTDTLSATVSLTQANIIAMGVTPVQILAAASAGTYYVVDLVEVIHTYSTAAYTGGGDVQLQYDSGAVAITLFADTIVTAASSSNVVAKPTIYALDASTGSSEGFAIAGAVAKSITITNAGGAFAAGNAANIIKVRLTYRLVTALT
jgi:ribose 5-phosphate isomerase RpiB